MKALFGMLAIAAVVALAGTGTLVVSSSAVEAQAAKRSACIQTCLGRGIAQVSCERRCGQRYSR
jgi:hypothetical protein